MKNKYLLSFMIFFFHTITQRIIAKKKKKKKTSLHFVSDHDHSDDHFNF